MSLNKRDGFSPPERGEIRNSSRADYLSRIGEPKVLIDTIVLLGIFQGLFLAVALLKRKNNSVPNKIQASLILLLAVDLGYVYIINSGAANKYPHLLYLDAPIPFLYIALIFFYIETITGKIKKFKFVYLVNLIPFFIYFIFTFFEFYILSADEKLAYISRQHNSGYSIVGILYNASFYVTALIYHIILFKRVLDYGRDVKNYFSDAANKLVVWLWILLIISSVIWLAALSMNFYEINMPDVFGILYTVTIYISAYKMLSTPEIFLLNSGMTAALSAGKNEGDVRTEEVQLNMFREYIERNKSYLNPEITISDICSSINIPVHRISKALNGILRKNFYFFINEYRVEEAGKMLSDRVFDGRPVLDIGFDSGFNSKSTFNDIFKKITGLTPTEFRANSVKSVESA